MEFAFSTNAFKKYSLVETINVLSEIGYTGVEILCDIPHAYPKTQSDTDISKIRQLLTRLNISISNLNAFTLFAIDDTYHPSWIEINASYRKLRIDHTIDCIKLAGKLGAKNISTEPGGPIVSNELSKDKLLKIFEDGINQVLDTAEKENVTLLIEPEPDLLIENSEQFDNFIKNFDSESVGLNLDIGHFFCVGEDPSEVIHKLSEYIRHVHLEDISAERLHNHLILGEGAIDISSTLKSLKDIGYDGFITVELYPYQDCPAYAAKQSMKFIKSLDHF
ncbi:MAG TPA: sugar phosphate isomerase/epimerase family protein [Nitrososphaeraceae archaeon]|nr:sugar phosphate isomerase/epimerase family protein [Nitrososphaeraceae archaeon]